MEDSLRADILALAGSLAAEDSPVGEDSLGAEVLVGAGILRAEG